MVKLMYSWLPVKPLNYFRIVYLTLLCKSCFITSSCLTLYHRCIVAFTLKFWSKFLAQLRLNFLYMGENFIRFNIIVWWRTAVAFESIYIVSVLRSLSFINSPPNARTTHYMPNVEFSEQSFATLITLKQEFYVLVVLGTFLHDPCWHTGVAKTSWDFQEQPFFVVSLLPHDCKFL